jgi:hypothetical protein
MALLASSDDFDPLLSSYTDGEGDIVLALALLHPKWLPPWAPVNFRGSQTFGIGVDARFNHCNSRLLWGYECPFDGGVMHSDHLFPWALGGHTVGGNRVVLCNAHNSMKSSDIHVYPWERPVPEWASEALERVVRLRAVRAGGD